MTELADKTAFADLLAQVRPEVEARLARLWDEQIARLLPHGEDVAAIARAARELTLRGGKRFRAALVVAGYLGAREARGEGGLDAAYELGAALELMQSYLLIQDDWMDGDRMRRGGPSAHASLGETFASEHVGDRAAMLASDLTWSLGIRVMSGLPVAPERALAAIRMFSAVHEDVIAGQQLDLLGKAEDVEAMHALKTGSYTVRGPLLLGATLAGAPAETLAALAAYAAPVGVAFQLRDDLLGTFGEATNTGKAEGGDLRAGKRTAVIVAAEPLLDAGQRLAVARAFGKAEAPAPVLAAAAAALEACGARRVVAERLVALSGAAALLASDLPVGEHARLLLVGAARMIGEAS